VDVHGAVDVPHAAVVLAEGLVEGELLRGRHLEERAGLHTYEGALSFVACFIFYIWVFSI
jgi:hypothetical protein